jgi:hypothetical protein
MLRRLLILGVTMLANLVIASAMATIDVTNLNCFGVQSSTLGETMTLGCSGDFLLTGGSISAPSKILLESTGSMALMDLALTAPVVEFTSGGSITLASTVSFSAGAKIIVNVADGHTFTYGGPFPGSVPVVVSEPSTLNVGNVISLIPEPHLYVHHLLGLMVLGLFCLRRGGITPR